MKIITDYSTEELKKELAEIGEPNFRAKQIFKAVHMWKNFKDMTDLKLSLRERLAEIFVMPTKIIEERVSKDGTIKYLFKLADENIIEGVLMKYKYGYTQCVSTQVGCRMGCTFCASTIDGLVRNLTAGEILGQILEVNCRMSGSLENRAITNVVLMGSGEPLDNFNNTVKFLELISDENGINISYRNISLSTCGIVPKMIKLADLGLSINLTVSLHAPFDDMRQEIMPIAKIYKIVEIIEACKYFFKKTGRRVYFEYSLIQNINDTKECAQAVANLLRSFPCHVNLIRLNTVKERNLKSATKDSAVAFLNQLTNKGISATIRRQIGSDIEGACGQLRNQYVGRKDTVSSDKKP